MTSSRRFRDLILIAAGATAATAAAAAVFNPPHRERKSPEPFDIVRVQKLEESQHDIVPQVVQLDLSLGRLPHRGIARPPLKHAFERVAPRHQDASVGVDRTILHDERHVAPCRVVHEALGSRETGERQRGREAERQRGRETER